MEANNNITSLRVASFSCYLSNPDDQSFVHKLGGSHEEPYPAAVVPSENPFSVRATKASTTKTSSNNTQDNLVNLRVESFSSYLKTEEDNFAFKTSGAAPVQDPTIAFVFPPQTLVGTQKHQERTKLKDGELSIFGADQYFNRKLEYGALTTTGVKYGGQTNKGMVNLPHLKPSSRTGTPSIYSEASSLNSQSALLQNLPRNRYQTNQKKMTGRRFFASFGCPRQCSGKKAVCVDKSLEAGHSQPGSKHLTGHSALRSGTASVYEKPGVAVKKHLSDQDQTIEEQRKSIEVFGSGKMRKGDIAVNLERKLSMLTWDAIPKAQNLPNSTIGSSTICDDMASDASSDLFEIENICSSGYGLMNSQTSDYVPGCMSPSTQYAPSEASIDWSVITASAAGYSSVISDYDANRISISGDTTSRNAACTNTKTIKNAVGKEDQKARPGGLLGCKSHKAVSVVETIYKTGENTKHHQRG